jgi:cation transport regulator ChaB
MPLPWMSTFVDNVMVEIYKTDDGVVVMRGGTILPPKERDEVLQKAGLYDFVMKVHAELAQQSVTAALTQAQEVSEGTARRGRRKKEEMTAHLVAEPEEILAENEI